MRVNATNLESVGIFGITGPSAVILNIKLFKNAITVGNMLGTLVGINNGTIRDSLWHKGATGQTPAASNGSTFCTDWAAYCQ